MGPEHPQDQSQDTDQATAAQFLGEPEAGEVPAWEMVDAGRYMPRRIRGSCRGRALG